MNDEDIHLIVAQQELEYRKEAVRLAELRLEAQDQAYNAQTKKVVLMGSVCFVFIGFLFTFPIEKEKTYDLFCLCLPAWGAMLIFKYLPCLPFFISLYHSFNSLDLKSFKLPGFSPKYTTDKCFESDSNKLTERMLIDYEERIANNAKAIDSNGDKMEVAKNWLIFGILFAVVVVVVRELVALQAT